MFPSLNIPDFNLKFWIQFLGRETSIHQGDYTKTDFPQQQQSTFTGTYLVYYRWNNTFKILRDSRDKESKRIRLFNNMYMVKRKLGQEFAYR